MDPKDFRATVIALATQRDKSVADISFRAYDPNIKGTNPDTMKSVMAGRRHPTPVLMEAVAKVLEVPPETFGEYRLALARKQLDEREVGYSQALSNLDRIERAMQTRPRQATNHASAPAEASPRPRQASGRAARNQKAG